MKSFRSFARHLIAVACTVTLFTSCARAETLDDANRAFAQGHYHESTLGFQAVLTQKGYSAPVLFDLGNSYFREGNLAQAILAYKRAQWLAPSDPDIAVNLRHAEKVAGLSEAGSHWFDKFGQVMSPSAWAWTGSGALALFCIALLLARIQPARQSSFFWLSTVSALVLLFAVAGAFFSSGGLREAIITDKNATALISPFPTAQVVFSPIPGETVTVQKSYDGFLLVKDSTGRTGWISQAQLTPLLPTTSPAS